MPRLIVPGGNPQAYKVVKRREDGTLCSFGCPEGAEIEYPPRKWVRPEVGCGPLTLWPNFDEVAEAENIEVWSAEYVLCHRSKEVWFRAGEENIPVIATPHSDSILAWRVRLLEKCDPSLCSATKVLPYLNHS